MTEDEVRQGALELFGIENLDVNMELVNQLAPHGGFGPFSQVSNFINDGDRYYLTVRTYVDISKLIVADEFVITLRKSDGMYPYVFENIEIRYSSGIEPGGIST